MNDMRNENFVKSSTYHLSGMDMEPRERRGVAYWRYGDDEKGMSFNGMRAVKGDCE